MAGFYHFLPGLQVSELVRGKQISRDTLRRFGLDDVLRDCSEVPDHIVVTEVSHGPDNKSGLCLYPKSFLGSDPPGWSFRPDHQEWMQFGERWLGWEKQQPPTPEDLSRQNQIKDYVVWDKLRQEWSVPCARTPDPSRSSMPVEYGFDAAGNVVQHRSQDYASLWNLSGEVLDAMRGTVDRNHAWLVGAALTVLQANYRLGKAEVNALQQMGQALLTRETVGAILLAFIDNDLEQEAVEQKKTSTLEQSSDTSAVD